jgi:putative flippase GtrA
MTTAEKQGRTVGAEIAKLVRANLSSTVATAVDWGLVSSLVWLGVYYLQAAATGAVAGAVTDFSIKRYWAFERGPARRALHHEGTLYVLVAGCALGLNLLGTWAVVSGRHLPPVPGYILVSMAVAFAWNYPMHRLVVFRRSEGSGTGSGEASGWP